MRKSTFSTGLQCKQESKRLAKAIRASPRVNLQSQAKERSQKTKKNPKDIPRDPKVSKAHARVKTSKTGISGLENLKTETSSETQESEQLGQVHNTDTSWMERRLKFGWKE